MSNWKIKGERTEKKARCGEVRIKTKFFRIPSVHQKKALAVPRKGRRENTLQTKKGLSTNRGRDWSGPQ